MLSKTTSRLPVLVAIAAIATGCVIQDIWESDDPSGGAWPDDLARSYSAFMPDATGDFEIAPGGAPPYSEPTDYPPIDVTRISMAVVGDYVYMRVDLDGVIPAGPVQVGPSGELEAQTVYGQSLSVNLDTDNSDATGSSGEGIHRIDIFFATNHIYGEPFTAYANYDFPTQDVHVHNGHLEGELGEGGPGSSYYVVRFDISGLDPRFFPRGTTVEKGAWSEAESDLYHHYAFDPLSPSSWSLPN